MFLWDKLLVQAKLMVNLLCQASVAPHISAWEYFNGPFNYDATPIGLVGCKVFIHNKPSTHHSWDFRAQPGYNIEPALHHYQCFLVADHQTKALLYSNTIEFCHTYLTQPMVTPADHIIHATNFLSCALTDAPSFACDSQLKAINSIHAVYAEWKETHQLPNVAPPTTDPVAPDHAPLPWATPLPALDVSSPRVCPPPLSLPSKGAHTPTLRHPSTAAHGPLGHWNS